MKHITDSVQKFHDSYKVPAAQSPILVDHELALLRFKLMEEENQEYLDACMDQDLTEIADALGDKLYILAGTIITHGMQHIIVDVFNEIHRSNMSKLGEDGQPIFREDGKILKGPDYFKPDLKPIVDGKG